MLVFCELYVIRDELALLGRTAHHPRSWASTSYNFFFSLAGKMSKREIAAAAAKKYVLSLDNATANPPADRFHSVITLITLGKAEEGENINREKFLQAILTEFFIEYPILAVPAAITDPQSVVVTVLDNVILTKLVQSNLI